MFSTLSLTIGKLELLKEKGVPPTSDEILACRRSSYTTSTKKEQDIWIWYATSLLPAVNSAYKSSGGKRLVSESITPSDEALVLVFLDIYRDLWTKLWKDGNEEDMSVDGNPDPSKRKNNRKYDKNIKLTTDDYNDMYDRVCAVRIRKSLCTQWDEASQNYCTGNPGGAREERAHTDDGKKKCVVRASKKTVRSDWDE